MNTQRELELKPASERDFRGVLRNSLIFGGLALLFWQYGVKHPETFSPLLDTETKFGRNHRETIRFSIASPDEISLDQINFLKNYANEFKNLFASSSLAKEERAVMNSLHAQIVFVPSRSPHLRAGEFCSPDTEGHIFVNRDLIFSGIYGSLDREFPLSPEIAKTQARITWPAILDKIVQFSLSNQIKEKQNVKEVFVLICSELSLASALRTLAIVSEVDNKNADKWSELLRRPFLSDYAHYLSLVGIILDSPYDLDLALEKDLMSISRSSFMPLRELSDFVHNPENEDELLKSMTADELFYLQQLIGSPESRRQISNLLIRSIRSSITECCSVKIETWCSEIKRPNLTESGLEFCLDQISLTIKKVGGLNVLSSSLREKLESAGITALSKISVSISSSGNEENSHFLLKQLNISLQIGGSIPDSKKTLFQKFIINEIKLRERDPLWGLWSTPERFQIELDNISRLLNCISSFFSRSEGLKELNKVELLIKKLKKGIQTFEEYPKSKFLT